MIYWYANFDIFFSFNILFHGVFCGFCLYYISLLLYSVGNIIQEVCGHYFIPCVLTIISYSWFPTSCIVFLINCVPSRKRQSTETLMISTLCYNKLLLQHLTNTRSIAINHIFIRIKSVKYKLKFKITKIRF